MPFLERLKLFRQLFLAQALAVGLVYRLPPTALHGGHNIPQTGLLAGFSVDPFVSLTR